MAGQAPGLPLGVVQIVPGIEELEEIHAPEVGHGLHCPAWKGFFAELSYSAFSAARLSSRAAIRSAAFLAFSRSALTTASGAREVKFSLESFPFRLARFFLALSSSLEIRSCSLAMSTSWPMGI